MTDASSLANKFLESSMAADAALVTSVPLGVRVLFFLTNLPYWVLCFSAITTLSASSSSSRSSSSTCDASVYAFFASLVAVSSTVMHSTQLHLCGGEMCYSKPAQSIAKRVDMSCAVLALIGCVYCGHLSDLYVALAVAIPLFVFGAIVKRQQRHYLYMLTHGLWHLVTAAMVWHVIWPPFAEVMWDGEAV
jgi:hypothetical protein